MIRATSGLIIVALGVGVVAGRAAQTTTRWPDARVTTTDLLSGQTERGRSVFFFACSMTRSGCHIATVEGERGASFVRVDGSRGRSYQDISHPQFSFDGSAVGYVVREQNGAFVVVNGHEGQRFAEVLPDTLILSCNGKRHAYQARKEGRLVEIVDGEVQAQAEGDLAPWIQPAVFSADGSSVGYLEGSPSRRLMRTVVNGKAGALFDGIDLRSLWFSPDGSRFAYAINERGGTNQWSYVLDGHKERLFDRVGVDFAFSPDGKRTAYTAAREGQWFLVVDRGPEVKIEGIVDHTLAFSPDSKRLAYAACRPDHSSYIVLDGQPGPVYDGIGASAPPDLTLTGASMRHDYSQGSVSASSVVFSPDSRRLAYLAHRGVKKVVVVDGQPQEIEMDWLVGGILFSSDSRHLAYGGREGGRFFVVVDGRRGADYDALGHFEMSPDRSHFTYAVKKGNRMVVVVDGQEQAEYDALPAGPVFRADGVLEFLAADKQSLDRVEVKGF